MLMVRKSFVINELKKPFEPYQTKRILLVNNNNNNIGWIYNTHGEKKSRTMYYKRAIGRYIAYAEIKR